MKRFCWTILFLGILLLPAQADIGTADPLYLGLGARPLGMGKAFNAVANDGSTPFTNPGGLGFIHDTKAISMTTKILMEVDYQLLGAVMPLQGLGTLGIGYVGRGINEIALGTGAAIVGGRLDPTLLQYGSVSDQVIFVSLGVPLGIKNDLAIGTTLRYYRKSSAGSNLLNGYDANGVDMDLGLMWQVNRNLRMGLTFQNFLPNAGGMWGSVKFANGTVDGIDSIMKLGLAYQMAGRRWLVAADLEKNLDQSAYPFLLHLGVEWHPTDELFFRAGLDQTPLPPANAQAQATTQTDPTMGVGFNWGGIRFDYAFHPFGAVDNLTSHFFSISLIGPEPVDAEPTPSTQVPEPVPGLGIAVSTPADKTIVRENQVLVSGLVSAGVVVRIDGVSLVPESTGRFQKMRTLDIGRNDISVSTEKVQVRRRVLRLARYNDVNSSAYKEPVELLATLGTLSEDGDGFFNGKRVVTRAELADILVKIKKYQLPPSVAGVWENLDTVVNDGLIKGYPDGKFKTTRELTNAQLAVVLARLEFGSEVQGDANPNAYPTARHWADNAINQLAGSGVYQRTEFSPYNGFVTKEKLALLLYKTKIVRSQVDRLLNFEDGEEFTPVEVRSSSVIRSSNEPEVVPREPVPVNREGNNDLKDFQSLMNTPAPVAPAVSGVMSLAVNSPVNGQVVKKPEINFQGQASQVKSLSLNGKAVYVRPDGKFFQKYPLKPGKNTLNITSVGNDGISKTQVRTVIYRK